MKPGTKHERVEKLKAQRQQMLAQLEYIDEAGQRRQRYAPELHASKIAEIDKAFEADLVAMMEEAQAQADAASAALAKVDNPYSWLLGPPEAHDAAALAGFIREDFANMGAGDIAAALDAARGRPRIERWLIYRYGTRRAAELDSGNIDSAPNMTQRALITRAADAMRNDLLLPTQAKELADAQAKLKDARDLFDASEWAQPSVRQAAADRWRVNVDYLPD